jgi:hypothetical protein
VYGCSCAGWSNRVLNADDDEIETRSGQPMLSG